jgi:hypothetical protein
MLGAVLTVNCEDCDEELFLPLKGGSEVLNLAIVYTVKAHRDSDCKGVLGKYSRGELPQKSHKTT